jgi:hypothetical protein
MSIGAKRGQARIVTSGICFVPRGRFAPDRTTAPQSIKSAVALYKNMLHAINSHSHRPVSKHVHPE